MFPAASSRRVRRSAVLLASLSVLTGLSACTSGRGGAAPTGPGAAPGSGGGSAGGCSPVEVIAARGTGEPQSGSIIMGGVSRGIAQRVGGNVYEVRYPASVDYLNGPNQGATDALNRLTARSAACPEQRYVLTGYSEGAMVMVTLMGRIPANLQPRVVAAVLYGSPYFKQSSPAAAGSARSANGLVPVLGVPTSFAAKTKDYCNAGDPICGAGANIAAHISYSQYNNEAIAFAVSKVQGG